LISTISKDDSFWDPIFFKGIDQLLGRGTALSPSIVLFLSDYIKGPFEGALYEIFTLQKDLAFKASQQEGGEDEDS
jgi:hypothetical protein